MQKQYAFDCDVYVDTVHLSYALSYHVSLKDGQNCLLYKSCAQDYFACSLEKAEYVKYDLCAIHDGERLVSVLSLKCKTGMFRKKTAAVRQTKEPGADLEHV